MGGKRAPRAPGGIRAREQRLGLPHGSPNFCSSVDPGVGRCGSASLGPWGPVQPTPASAPGPSGHLHLRHLPFPTALPPHPALSLCALSMPGASRILSRVYNGELSRALSKATARMSGSSGGTPLPCS